jgi:hypothetical protein
MKQLLSLSRMVWNRTALFLGVLLLPSVTVMAQTPVTAETLTNASIVQMTKKFKFSPEIIKSKIQTSLCNFSTSTDSLAVLKNQGVSDDVLALMVLKATPNTPEPGVAPKESWGKIIRDEKGKKIVSYISKRGREFKVGQTITLGDASRIDSRYDAIKYSISKSHSRFFSAGDLLEYGYNRQSVTILAMDASSNDPFKKGNDLTNTVYFYINVGSLKQCEINIEMALDKKEVL